MTTKLASYIEAGRALDAWERLEAARQLLLSVDESRESDDAAIGGAWDEVIERRAREILDGTADVVDGREGLACIRGDLAAHRL